MKKKLVVVLTVCLLALTSAFASHSVSLQVAPYAIQNIRFQTSKEYDSEYGFGVKAGYRYAYDDLAFVGADLSFSDYNYGDTDERYLVLSTLAKYGFMIPINNLYLDFDMGAGVDLRIYDSVSKFYPSFGFYMGLGYKFNEMIEFTGGADLHVAWQDHSTEAFSSTDTAILCRLGARVNL